MKLTTLEHPKSLVLDLGTSKILNLRCWNGFQLWNWQNHKFTTLKHSKPWIQDIGTAFKNLNIPSLGTSKITNSRSWDFQNPEFKTLEWLLKPRIQDLGTSKFLKLTTLELSKSWIQDIETAFKILIFKILEHPKSRVKDLGTSKILKFITL